MNNSTTPVIGEYTSNNAAAPAPINVLGTYENSAAESADPVVNADTDTETKEHITGDTLAGVTKKAGVRVTAAVYDALISQFTAMLDGLINFMTYYMLGYESLTKVDKEEIIANLSHKRDLFMQVAYDPRAQQIVRDLSLSLSTILSVIIDASAKQLDRVSDAVSKSIGDGFGKVSVQMMKSLKNMVRIIPVVGDAYIITENIFSMGRIGTELGKTAGTLLHTTVDTAAQIKAQLVDNPVIKEQMSLFGSATTEFKHMRDKIAATVDQYTPSVPENPVDTLKIGIHDTANAVSNTLRRSSQKGGRARSHTNRRRHRRTRRRRQRATR